MADIDLGAIEFGGTLPPLYSALLIQLVLNGTLEPSDLDMIAMRLEADDMPNAATSVRALMLSIAIEADFLVSRIENDGGNDET